MTQDEIIRIAREAGFEVVDGQLRLYFDGSKALLKPNYMGTVVDGLKEFAALVAANEKKFWMEQIEVECNEAVLAERKKQAEQEPVAWLVQYKDCHTFVFGRKPEFIVDGVVEPLYTQPVRTKDLTDGAIWEILETHPTDIVTAIRAVIAAYKEKN